MRVVLIMSFSEYGKIDALGIAELVKKREISSKEVCETAIERIEALNPKINAVITKCYDKALFDCTKKHEGIFAGVPFLIKDLLCYEAGIPYSMGCKSLKNYMPDHDSELVKRFKQTGLIILGRTNVPEFGLVVTTESKAFGPVCNPWNLAYSSGGSSGGSAAAIACGMVPMASGNDGGGSIRVPASCCNLFGLKPTRGRNPTGPDHGELWQGAAVEHILTKTVRDSAAMLDATSGVDMGAPYIIEKPYGSFLEATRRDPEKLKIAFTTRTLINTDVDNDCIYAVEKMAKLLDSLGHFVCEDSPVIDGFELAKAYFTVYFAEVVMDLLDVSKFLKRSVKRSDVEGLTWFLADIGRLIRAEEILIAKRCWERAGRIMANFHLDYDLFLTPTMAYPPVKLGLLMPSNIQEIMMYVISKLKLTRTIKNSSLLTRKTLDGLSYTPFTFIANVTGAPAVSIPAHFTEYGLPVGVQFIAPFGREDILFSLSAQLESELGWDKLCPP